MFIKLIFNKNIFKPWQVLLKISNINKHYRKTTLVNNEDIFRLFIPIEPLPYNAQCLVQFSSVAQLCPAICDPMDCSIPGFPVHHLLLELVQTHVHQVGETIQPSHPLSSPSPLAFSLSQHQGFFQWVSSLHQVVKVLEFQLQHQSFQWYSGLISLGLTGWISLQSKRLSRVFSNTTVQKHQFFSAQLSL